MPSCPHCGENSISRFAKFCSDSAAPVRCQNCSGLSYLHRRETTSLNAIIFPGFIIALVVVVLTNDWWPFYVWGAVWLLGLWRVLWLAPLTPITEAQAATNRLYGNIIIGLAFAAAAIWWLYRYVSSNI